MSQFDRRLADELSKIRADHAAGKSAGSAQARQTGHVVQELVDLWMPIGRSAAKALLEAGVESHVARIRKRHGMFRREPDQWPSRFSWWNLNNRADRPWDRLRSVSRPTCQPKGTCPR